MARYEFARSRDGNEFYVGQISNKCDGLFGWGYNGFMNGDFIISNFDGHGRPNDYSIFFDSANKQLVFANCDHGKIADGLNMEYTPRSFKFYDSIDGVINGPIFELLNDNAWAYYLHGKNDKMTLITFKPGVGLQVGITKGKKWVKGQHYYIEEDSWPCDLTIEFDEFNRLTPSIRHFTWGHNMYENKYGGIFPPGKQYGVYINHPTLSETVVGEYGNGQAEGISLHAISDESRIVSMFKNGRPNGPCVTFFPDLGSLSYSIKAPRYKKFLSGYVSPQKIWGSRTEDGILIRIVYYNYGNADEYDMVDITPQFRITFTKRYNANTDDCKWREVVFGDGEE